MAYLGNKPVNNFVSFAKQDITGNGGTSYSLDYPVTGANDIELFINNVRQEPTEAYSCSGSTLTLTEAVTSTDDVYVIFRGRALGTVGHPADQSLEATTGTFSGAVSAPSLKHPDSASNNISVDSSGNTSTTGNTTVGGTSVSTSNGAVGRLFGVKSTQNNVVTGETSGGYGLILESRNTGRSGSERIAQINMSADGSGDGYLGFYTSPSGSDVVSRMNIDSAGRVTMPSQPYARASCNVTGTGKIPLNAYNAVRGGMSIDNTNQRIIVPVSGAYIIGYNHLGNAGSGSCSMNIRVNGTTISPSAAQDIGNGNDNFGFQTIYQLAANDYIEFQVFAGATHGNADYNIMYAYLFG